MRSRRISESSFHRRAFPVVPEDRRPADIAVGETSLSFDAFTSKLTTALNKRKSQRRGSARSRTCVARSRSRRPATRRRSTCARARRTAGPTATLPRDSPRAARAPRVGDRRLNKIVDTHLVARVVASLSHSIRRANVPPPPSCEAFYYKSLKGLSLISEVVAKERGPFSSSELRGP